MGLRDAQVWDLLAPGGKQELELVKSIGGFDIPDLTQIGEALFFYSNRPRASAMPCMPMKFHGLAWLLLQNHYGSCRNSFNL